jgi:hypothetical protein
MSSESVCQVARSWVKVGSFRTRLVVMLMNSTSVRNILGTPLYTVISALMGLNTVRLVIFTRSRIKIRQIIHVRSHCAHS